MKVIAQLGVYFVQSVALYNSVLTLFCLIKVDQLVGQFRMVPLFLCSGVNKNSPIVTDCFQYVPISFCMDMQLIMESGDLYRMEGLPPPPLLKHILYLASRKQLMTYTNLVEDITSI